MSKPTKKPSGEVMELYVAEIDRFATMLREQQKEIDRLAAHASEAKGIYENAKEAVREAKENEHNTVSLLLKFIRPGSIEIMPLFDHMEPADEKVHGEGSTEWRKEPISSLKLSSLATRALIDADIVLVGQLQDRVMKNPADWYVEFGITDGMSQAIEAKLHDFIEEHSK